MPKQTFLNLPKEKRDKIINISLIEFAQHSYKGASLSRIVEKAGIAKGSMYQYFKNKKELYLYLIDFTGNRKLSYMDLNLDPSIENFYMQYKQIIFLAVKYNFENLYKTLFFYNTLQNRNDKEIREMVLKMEEKKRIFLKKHIVKAQEKGQVRKDADTDLITFIINQISLHVDAYFRIKFKFDYEKLIKEGIAKLPISNRELESMIDEIIEIFKHGFEPKDK